LAETEELLGSYPRLVFAGEARSLKQDLAEVAAWQAFLLQGGDCAEALRNSSKQYPRYIRVILQIGRWLC